MRSIGSRIRLLLPVRSSARKRGFRTAHARRSGIIRTRPARDPPMFRKGSLPATLPADPMPLFEEWFAHAREQSAQRNPDAMVIATVDSRRSALGARRAAEAPGRGSRLRGLLHELRQPQGPRDRRESASRGRDPLGRAGAAGAARRPRRDFARLARATSTSRAARSTAASAPGRACRASRSPRAPSS